MKLDEIVFLEEKVMAKLFKVYNEHSKNVCRSVSELYSVEEFVEKSESEKHAMKKIESLVRGARSSVEIAQSYPEENLEDIIEKLKRINEEVYKI